MSDKKIYFERGIPGFLDEREYYLISLNKAHQLEEESPFAYLKSTKNDSLAFVVVNPFLFFPDYEFRITDEVISRLGIESQEDVAVFVIVTMQGKVVDATANLLGPVVINLNNRKAEQLFLDGSIYTTKHLLFAQHAVTAGGE